MGSKYTRAVFVRFSHGGGQSFDWRLATIAGMEVAKLVPWNSLLNYITSVSLLYVRLDYKNSSNLAMLEQLYRATCARMQH